MCDYAAYELLKKASRYADAVEENEHDGEEENLIKLINFICVFWRRSSVLQLKWFIAAATLSRRQIS